MTKWNQVQQGNAHVSDGQEGFWAAFPAGTSAKDVLADYMATADYSAATGAFAVTAEIDGETCSCQVGPGGTPLDDDGPLSDAERREEHERDERYLARGR